MALRTRPADVLPCLSGTILSGELNIRCPNCGSDYTHVRHAGTLVGSDDNEATPAYSGTAPSGATGSRRSALEIVFTCEGCPKLFALVIQQHKGNNLIQIDDDVKIPG